MLRVLVDRSVVEAFGQRGRATWAGTHFGDGNATAIVWEPAEAGPGARRPTVHAQVWEMGTAWY